MLHCWFWPHKIDTSTTTLRITHRSKCWELSLSLLKTRCLLFFYQVQCEILTSTFCIPPCLRIFNNLILCWNKHHFVEKKIQLIEISVFSIKTLFGNFLKIMHDLIKNYIFNCLIEKWLSWITLLKPRRIILPLTNNVMDLPLPFNFSLLGFLVFFCRSLNPLPFITFSFF